jgi:Ser/Thr protein kinase RdoA (MazF antagonist)
MESIIRQFFDFQELIGFAPYGTGHINDTYRVTIRIGESVKNYLLQRLNHNVFRQPEAVMQNIRLVAEHLSRQDYPLENLAPVPTLDGRFLHRDEAGNYWRIFPFFEETITFDKVETPEQAYEAAHAFGSFARALDSMDATKLQPTIPGFHKGEKRLAYFLDVLKRAIPERLTTAQAEVEEVLQHQLIFKKIASLKLPLRVIHHDTKINNVLFDAATLKAVCVIDLDTVMPGIVLSDFGDMMRTSTSPADEDEADLSKVEMRKPFYEALLAGFLSEMGDLLTPVERDNLAEGGRWLTLMQVVRFLADYLEGDVYYKTHYPEHNLVRSRNQLALFRSMTERI